MATLEAYIVSINEDDILTRHNILGIFESHKQIENHVNNMDIDYTLEKHGDLYLCVSNLLEDDGCPEQGPIASLNLEFFRIKIEE